VCGGIDDKKLEDALQQGYASATQKIIARGNWIRYVFGARANFFLWSDFSVRACVFSGEQHMPFLDHHNLFAFLA
jgi:hypothetical protein